MHCFPEGAGKRVWFQCFGHLDRSAAVVWPIRLEAKTKDVTFFTWQAIPSEQPHLLPILNLDILKVPLEKEDELKS